MHARVCMHGARMVMIRSVRASVDGQRKVYERRWHLTTNWVSSYGPTKWIEG